MARKKSREQRKREKAKLREAAKRDGDFEARIMQRIERLEQMIHGNLLSEREIKEVKGLINSMEYFYNHLAHFPGRQEALTGLLCASGMAQLDIDPAGPDFKHITCLYSHGRGLSITITNKPTAETL